MSNNKLSLEDLTHLNDGTVVDLDVIPQENSNVFNLVKDEIDAFISLQKIKPSKTAVGFYESLPNTELRKNIEGVLKMRNIKETAAKKSAQQEFDAKMARIRKIKSKTYRKLKRRDKLKKLELLEEEGCESSQENETEEEDIKEFNPVMNFERESECDSKEEESTVDSQNSMFEVPGFKGNELDFMEEKNAVEESDAPKMIEHTLPGWNSWAGEGIELQKNKHNTWIEKKDGIKETERQDYRIEHVIINEHVEINEKYKSNKPYGYTSLDYSEKLKTPISLETTSLKIFNRFVRMNNKEETAPGKDIEPKEFDPQY